MLPRLVATSSSGAASACLRRNPLQLTRSLFAPIAAVDERKEGQIPLHELSRRSFHTSQPSEFIFRKRFFKKFFRKRHHPTDVPQDPLKMTLFNQWMVPEDLQLPKPGDPIRRIGAGFLDLLVSGAIGGAVGTAAWHGLQLDLLGGLDPHEAVQSAVQAGLGTGFASWLVRDAFGDGGNRSLGKEVFKLELAYWDGTLSSRLDAALRNWYFLALPLMALHPMLEMAGAMVFTFDAASVLLTQDARKVGDYVLGTRVVDERPDREGRLRDLEVTAEVRLLREEVEELVPGYLKASKNPDDEWYEDLQKATQSSVQLIKGSQAMNRAKVMQQQQQQQKAASAAAALAGSAAPPSELPSLFAGVSGAPTHAAASPAFGSEIATILGKVEAADADGGKGNNSNKAAAKMTLSSISSKKAAGGSK